MCYTSIDFAYRYFYFRLLSNKYPKAEHRLFLKMSTEVHQRHKLPLQLDTLSSILQTFAVYQNQISFAMQLMMNNRYETKIMLLFYLSNQRRLKLTFPSTINATTIGTTIPMALAIPFKIPMILPAKFGETST